MKVHELKELLEKCHDQAEVVLDIEITGLWIGGTKQVHAEGKMTGWADALNPHKIILVGRT